MIDLSGRIAIVTGAGRGLGRSHALALAARGAKVVVNDLSADAAELVADSIRSSGGEAIGYGADVTKLSEVRAMVLCAIERWAAVDILVNNAGLLRDRTFAKMDLSDFRLVLDVHLIGAVHCTKAVWDHMRERRYGRIVMTTSSSGLYGNFGQSSYSAAKMALVGLMQTLALEGERYDICVNCLAPTAATAMTESILPPEMLRLLDPVHVTPALLALVAESAPTRAILCAGAGSVEQAHITLTRGIFVGDVPDAADQVVARLAEISDRAHEIVPAGGSEQADLEVEKAVASDSASSFAEPQF